MMQVNKKEKKKRKMMIKKYYDDYNEKLCNLEEFIYRV